MIGRRLLTYLGTDMKSLRKDVYVFNVSLHTTPHFSPSENKIQRPNRKYDVVGLAKGFPGPLLLILGHCGHVVQIMFIVSILF